jgi:hypothetical protein
MKHSTAVEARYAEQGEGKYFRHAYFLPIMNSEQYCYREDFYTIKDGKVYSIQGDGSLYPSGDSCMNTILECKEMGKYREGIKKPVVTRNFTRKQFLAIMKRSLLKKNK